MNNQHEIAMVRHWHGKAINSQAKAANYYRTYAKEADSWASRALVKANNAERNGATRMTRKDNAVEVFVCLVAVAFLLTLAMTIVEQPVPAIISYVGAGLFLLVAVAYTWQEHRYRKTYRKHLNARLSEVLKGGLDVTG